MRRCGEREFHNRFWVFYAGNFWWNHIPYANGSGDKMKRPLHLYDTWGLCIVHGFESGLVGDLNNVI